MKRRYFAYILATASVAAFLLATQSSPSAEAEVVKKPLVVTKSGLYLASNFAQRHHDWDKAHFFLDHIIKSGQNDSAMIERSMVLALGSGNTDLAVLRAQEVLENSPKHVLAELILVVDHFKNGNFEETQQALNTLPNDSTVQFIRPFLQGWLDAAQGKLAIEPLQNSTIQLFHAILISDYIGDFNEIEKIIDRTKEIVNIQPSELSRIGDLYAHVGLKDKALKSYNKVLKDEPNNTQIKEKIQALKDGKTKPLFDKIETPQQGVAKAFHDIANLFYHENNAEMARIFANLGRSAAPDFSETKILIAEMDRDFKNYDSALSLYESIIDTDPNFIKAQQQVADLYTELGNNEKALQTLNKLSKYDQSVDTYIKIGDFHRQQSNFGLALKSYDKAAKKLGGKITDEYWHIHYARGICYEQSNNWKRAEEEFTAALSYRPNNPYVLNYLGYAWADKGINLDKSLEMIKKAVQLRPSDGYITDSLGWVLYRSGQYQKAAVILERAVELLPYDPTINDHLGDAYWKVGRKNEARFQWTRAKNHSEDAKQIDQINAKLVNGLENQKTASK